jgi:hypothetical protein
MNLCLGRVAFLLVLLLLPSILSAGENSTVKCSVNEDRVWVYDSLATLNVAAKLKCGETVTILSRENGFAEIQAADGTEGYIPDENLLPTAPPTAAAQPNAFAPDTLVSAARAAAATRSVSMSLGKPRAGSSTARPAGAGETISAPDSRAENTLVAAAPTASTNLGRPTPSDARTPAQAASVRASEGSPISFSASSQPKSSYSAVASVQPAMSSHAPATQRPASGSMAMTSSLSAPLAAKSSADGRVDSSSTTAAAMKPAVARNVSDTSSEDEDDDESYLVRPPTESQDPACQFFFSGYGLSPGQFEWMIDNRRKEFPSVCPAATPSMVDYVIIFTHDEDSFSYNMPTPVHTVGGFSDWIPVVLYDMDSVPRSQIDKSKREYVWVFHVKRGAYDPSTFSPHRRFQFTKIESKYSRTVKDAFEFIETQDVDR